MTLSAVEFDVEKLREEELEEARAIQSVMLPSEPLRAGAVRISHQFQPVAAVGGDFLDYFELSDGSVGLYLENGPIAVHCAVDAKSQVAGSRRIAALQRDAICNF